MAVVAAAAMAPQTDSPSRRESSARTLIFFQEVRYGLTMSPENMNNIIE
jgi:hypothetical protein